MVRFDTAAARLRSRFVQNESGAISVDWAVMAAVATALTLAAAGSLTDSTNTFEDKVEATLKNNVSNVQATNSGNGRNVGANGSDEDGEIEFGFAGISPNTSTTSSRVQCGELVAGCGRSAETLSETFLMTDGSTWIRTTTTYTDDGSEAVVWLDETGRQTTDVPTLPDDLPTVVLN